MEKMIIEINGKPIQLSYKGFDEEIDIEDYLVVHHHNLVGDAITFPVLFNKIGLLKAEAEDDERRCKLDFEIFCASLSERKRNEIFKRTQKKATVNEVEDAVLMSPEYKVKREQYLSKQKNTQVIDALYWSAKDKSNKLEILSKKLIEEGNEKELIEETINGIEIRKAEGLIEKRKTK